MNCSNQSTENDKKAVCRSAYYQRYYVENRERILTRQKRYRTENAEILKTRRKRWYENNKERIVRSQRAYVQKNNEHVSNYQRKHCESNTARLNEYWRGYYAKNKELTDQAKTSWTKTKKNRTEYHAFWGLGPGIWETRNELSSQHFVEYRRSRVKELKIVTNSLSELMLLFLLSLFNKRCKDSDSLFLFCFTSL